MREAGPTVEDAARLRRTILNAAVEDNVDTMAGRLPKRLRADRRRQRWSRHAWTAVFPVGLAVGAAGIARWPAAARTALDPGVTVERRSSGAAMPAQPAPALLSRPVPANALALAIRRAVIDAGHGGDNLGTSSAGGLLEKDVSLDIAERTRQLLVARNFQAVMTRRTDVALSLWQRAAVANEQRGDIFVSIHLNSLRPSAVCGVETYYLGPSSEPDLDVIAARENEQSGYSLAHMRLLLEKIYTDARRDESSRLAHAVQRALVTTLRAANPALIDRGVKTAPFVVLVAAEMPAILAEVSCLSDTAEAERLQSIPYRHRIAEAVVAGIQAFAREVPLVMRSERTTNRGN